MVKLLHRNIVLEVRMSRIKQLALISSLLFCSYQPGYSQTYEGRECSDDCSGHKAGYEWAAENDITDEDQCDGNISSFREGCEAYVENPDRLDTEYDDDGNFIE